MRPHASRHRTVSVAEAVRQRVSIVVVIVSTFVLLSVMLSGGTAGAGGWAVSTIEPLTTAPAAGRDFPVAFTIRQHGQTPVSLEGTAIVIRRSTGSEESRFAATEDTDRTGFYHATVRFPTAGAWEWQIEQGWFGPQELGAIEVAASESAPTASNAADDGSSSALAVRAALSIATLSAAAWSVARIVGGRRLVSQSSAPSASGGRV